MKMKNDENETSEWCINNNIWIDNNDVKRKVVKMQTFQITFETKIMFKPHDKFWNYSKRYGDLEVQIILFHNT